MQRTRPLSLWLTCLVLCLPFSLLAAESNQEWEKQARAYLGSIQYTHGSWLNLVETLFGKMARTFLKHIRVASCQELKDRILLGIAEINEAPVVHRWKKFDALNT